MCRAMKRSDAVSPLTRSPVQETEKPAEGEGPADEDLQLKAERALACPCVASLREGPCGKKFSEAFVCFIKSTAEHKGSDCVESFLSMQACMLEYPDAFSKQESRDKQEEQRGAIASSEGLVSSGK